MGFFSRVENRMEDAIEGAADKMVSAPISPVQIAKQCEKQMKRNKMVGAGKQIAPTLYTVLVNEDDDQHLFGYYPTLAGETETYITARAHDAGLSLDGNPLVRFIADPALKHGKFDVIAECVAAPIIARLRDEEMERYGFAPRGVQGGAQGGRRAPQRVQTRGTLQSYDPDPYDTYDEYDNGYNAYTERDPYNNSHGNNEGSGSTNADDVFDPFGDNASGGAFDQAEDLRGLDASGNMTGAGVAAGRAAAGMGANPGAPAAGTAVTGAAAAGTAGAAAAGARPHMNLPQAQPLRATLTERTTGKCFALSASNVKLGRETNNDIVINDMGASRYHATIARGQDCWILSDQNSTNGTLVNNHEIGSVALRSGDVITIGTTEYIFAQA